MIRQQFEIENYWKVVVYYSVNYDLFAPIAKELIRLGASTETVKDIYDMLKSGEAKAVTCSNDEKHISIIMFNPHETKEDYINSIVHEAEHVKQAMLRTYNVEDLGEPPAYTIGYLVAQMYRVFKEIICNCL